MTLDLTKEDLMALHIDYYDEDVLKAEFDAYVDASSPPPRICTEWGDFTLSASSALQEVDRGDKYIECFKKWMRDKIEEGEYVEVGEGLFVKYVDYMLLILKNRC